MRRRYLVAWIAPAILAASSAGTIAQQPAAPAAPSQEQAAVFRGGVELMNLSVTATDKRGRSVTDLTRDDFVIFEDKKPQEIVSFAGVTQETLTPIGLGLVLDASLSMDASSLTPGVSQAPGSRLQSMRLAVDLLVNKRLRKDDEVYFIEFATDTRLAVDWTTDKRSVLDAVRRIKPRLGTSIYNSILAALDVSKRGRQKKQVMLVVTDGADVTSTVTATEVARAARTSDVIIYALVVDDEEGLRSRGDANTRRMAGELSQITDATGGRSLYVQGFGELEAAIAQLGKEFTQQYELAYARPPADGRLHDITVTVKRPDISVVHRRTYLANTPAPGR